MGILVDGSKLIFEAHCPACKGKHITKVEVKGDRFNFPFLPGEYKCDLCNSHYYLQHKTKEMLKDNDIIYFDVGGAYVVCDKREIIKEKESLK